MGLATRLSFAAIALTFSACDVATRSACDPNPEPGRVGSICGFENPEDVEVVASLGILVVSQMRHDDERGGGSLAFVRLDADDPTPQPLWPSPGPTERVAANTRGLDDDCVEPPVSGFAPHGISARRGDDPGLVRLAVVSHAPRESIELFDLFERDGHPVARWRGCVPLPESTVGNDVIFAEADEWLVTKYRPTQDDLGAAFYSVIAGLGGDTGEVLHWRPARGWRPIAETEGASPNGLLLDEDGTLYFSQTGTGRVGVVRPGRGTRDRRDVKIGGHPDNLAWSPDGRILAVTHTEGPAFLMCVLGRSPCRTAWSLFAIDPGTLDASELLHHDGSVVGGVASVAVHEDRFFFGAVFDDRIGVWRPPSRPTGARSGPHGGMLQTARSSGGLVGPTRR